MIFKHPVTLINYLVIYFSEQMNGIRQCGNNHVTTEHLRKLDLLD
jgi:hypothetical protein